MKPFSESCLQNQEVILSVIAPLLSHCQSVLEIGSGTGQHAVHFAAGIPHLEWYTSDITVHHPGIRCWLDEAGLHNTHAPLALDVSQQDWPEIQTDAVFTANTLHIMDWPMVEDCIKGVGRLLPKGGLFIVYGPFNYGGEYTSASNARFDQWLAAQNAGRAIRDFEDVEKLANKAGMVLQEDIAMPANNRVLCWCKRQEC